MSGRLPATGIRKTMPGRRTVSLASGITGSIIGFAGAILPRCVLVSKASDRVVCTNGYYRESLMLFGAVLVIEC
jgi:hypothetical protein